MNTITTAIVSLLAITTTASAGWIASVYPEFSAHPGMARVSYSAEKNEGYVSFGDALKRLEQQGLVHQLKSITIHPFIHEADFQRELFSILKRSSPRSLQEALQASGPSGNGNSPKIRQLYQPFMEAVLVTSVVEKIAVDLAAHDLSITRASGEKFMLIKDKEGHRFYCGLVLNIKRIAEPSDPPNDGPAASVENSDASGGGRHR
jgi:hypothetical protein